MAKNFLSVSIIFFGACLLISAWLISNAIQNIPFPSGTSDVTVSQPEVENKYELVVQDNKTLILFNKETGEYWKKPINSKGTSLDWIFQEAPNY